MNIAVLQNDLKAALSAALPAVAGKSTLPILSCVRLTTDAGWLRIAATDLNIGVVLTVNARIEADGAICVPAKAFSDLVSNFPDKPVVMQRRGSTFILDIACGNVKTAIHGMDPDDFPVLPTVDSPQALTVPGSVMRAMAARVGMAAKDDNISDRPILGGIHMVVDTARLIAEAADSYRAARLTLDHASTTMTEVIVPVQSMRYAAGVFGPDDEVAITMGYAHALFASDRVRVISRVIDGRYPDIDRVLPPVRRTQALVDVSEVRRAVRIATTIARESSKTIVLTLTPGEDETTGTIEVGASATEFGNAATRVECSVVGVALEWKANADYLKDALEQIPTDTVALEFASSTHPIVIRPVGDATYFSVIMPMASR